MSSPFRLTPPARHPAGWLQRLRLRSVVEGRFDRRLTVVRGGAGFGKTTLVLQAIEANELDPRGIDHWLGLRAQDAVPATFAAALRAAVGARGSGNVVEAVGEAVWRQSPSEVALTIDDVHHVAPGSEGAALLEKLLEELPRNGHLVLVGRGVPPVRLARRLAAGDAREIVEDDLAFTPAEQASFLELRAAPCEASESSAWPALLELSASAGATQVESYLWEEILDRLAPARRRDLARLAPLEWIDADRIAALTGTRLAPEALLGELPLTSIEPGGAARLHALWEPILESIDPEWSEDELGRGLDHLASTRHYHEAITLCARHAHEERIAPLLQRLIHHDWHSMVPEDLESLIALLPRHIATTPTAELLRALLALHRDPARAEPFFRSAMAGFHEAGDPDSEYVALTFLGYVAFFLADRDALAALIRDGERYDHPARPVTTKTLRASIALLESRHHDALAIVDEIRRAGDASALGADDAVVAIMALLDSGQPERALEECQSALSSASPFNAPAVITMWFDALWLSGQTGPKDLEPYDDALRDDAIGNAHNQAVALSVLGFQNTCAGRPEVARRQLDRARSLVRRGLGERAQMALAIGEMGLAAVEGDEEAARKRIEREFDALPPQHLLYRHTLRGAALASVVSPVLRRRVEAWGARGPCWELALQAARALISIRECGDVEPAARLPWGQHRRFGHALVPSMVLELAVAAASQGDDAAQAVARDLAAGHHDTLRRLSESQAGMRREAERLLITVPARPRETWMLRTLGELELVRDGVVVEDPSLRRGRVRAVLSLLAARGELTRDVICSEIWPTLDAASAANNLRVTLTHIRKVLEPDRRPGAGSYFLPLEGEVVRLRIGDGLDLDANRFEAHIAAAELADANGDPGTALRSYQKAIDLHRGPFLGDAPHADWGRERRVHLEQRLVLALVRSAELLLGRDELDLAVAYLDRAAELSPTSERVARSRALAYERRDGRAIARRSLREFLATQPLEASELAAETRNLAARLGVGVPSDSCAADPHRPGDKPALSDREREVLCFVEAGLSNAEIARRLCISLSTVKSHLQKIFDKLDVRRRAQAVTLARTMGILGPAVGDAGPRAELEVSIRRAPSR